MGWQEWPGDGPVLLALHGIGSRAQGWARLVACLPGWRVIAWEAPGYGPSDPLPVDWPVAAEYAAAALRLLDGLGVERAHVTGHSLGTLIGAALAVLAPGRVQTLTLASCAQGGASRPARPCAPPIRPASTT